MTDGVAAAFAHLHADAVDVLTRWPAPDAAQERLRQEYLDHLAAHPDAVAKAGPPAHLTGSCVVLDGSGERVLLTHHRKADAWFQFGGHLEADDASLWAAARREDRPLTRKLLVRALRDASDLDPRDADRAVSDYLRRRGARLPSGIGPAPIVIGLLAAFGAALAFFLLAG